MTARENSKKWVVPKRFALLWREWDGELVVFHPGSGDTHLLNAVAGAILKRLERAPASAEELVAHAAQGLDDNERRELALRIEGLVEELDELGLIEPVEL